MKEIEIKVRLTNKEAVLEKIQSAGCVLSEPVRQIDTVYVKTIGGVEEYLKNDHFVRIREKSDGRFIFTVKKPLSLEVLTKLEHETEVKDASELEQSLFLMGYQLSNKVIKNRKTGRIGDVEICIDEVEKLGDFIEVEKMSDGDADMVRKELNDFILSLGALPENEVRKGYDIMAIEAQN